MAALCLLAGARQRSHDPIASAAVHAGLVRYLHGDGGRQRPGDRVPSRQELKALARLRLREAEVLFAAGLYDGAAAVHDLDQLALLAGLRPRFRPAGPALVANWSVAQPWKPDRRYNPSGTYTRQDALDLLNAVRDPDNGLLRWIAKYW